MARGAGCARCGAAAVLPRPAGALLAGIVLGLITSLVSLGMYLVYRANRVLNFTAGELGLLPAVLTVMLIIESGLSWYLSFGLGFVAAAVLGVAVEFLIIRRFFEAPRLVVTVATIGVAQLLGVCALFLPGWWGARVQSQRIDAPFSIDFEIGSRVFNANHVVALVLAPLAILAVGILLRYTRTQRWPSERWVKPREREPERLLFAFACRRSWMLPTT